MSTASGRALLGLLSVGLAGGFAVAGGCTLIAGVEEGILATTSGVSAGGGSIGGSGGTSTGSTGGTGGTSTGSTGGTGGAAGTGGSTAQGGTGGTSTGSTGGGGGSATDPYYEAVMADGPIAYFRLAEAVGNVCQNEISSSSITATYPTGNSTRAVAGIRPENAAIQFDDGAAQLSVFGGMDFPGDVAFTIEAWVQIHDLANTGRFFDHRDSSPHHGTWLGRWTTNDHVRSETWDNGTLIFATVSQGVIPENTWLHVVLRHVAGDRDYLFVNGSEGDGWRLNTGDRGAVTSTFRWTGFVGVLDEFAVYDKALDPGRIAAHIVAQGQ